MKHMLHSMGRDGAGDGDGDWDGDGDGVGMPSLTRDTERVLLMTWFPGDDSTC